MASGTVQSATTTRESWHSRAAALDLHQYPEPLAIASFAPKDPDEEVLEAQERWKDTSASPRTLDGRHERTQMNAKRPSILSCEAQRSKAPCQKQLDAHFPAFLSAVRRNSCPGPAAAALRRPDRPRYRRWPNHCAQLLALPHARSPPHAERNCCGAAAHWRTSPGAHQRRHLTASE